MKKLLGLFTAACLAASLFSACGAPASTSTSASAAASEPASVSAASVADSAAPVAAERTTIRIGSLKGPTTMGIVKLLDDADNGAARHDYQSTIAGTADEITPLLIQGELDVALVPCNLASVLYSRTEGAVQVAAINTLGVLYVVTTSDEISSVENLRGKTVYSTGQGTTPEYVLNHVLTQNGLTPGTDVDVVYMSEATEVAAAMQASSGYPIAMLPQPYVTSLSMQMENLHVALDITEEWGKVSDSDLVTGVVIARRAFIEENPEAFAEFLEDYAASVEFVNANTAEAAELVAKYEIVPKAAIAEKALPACNITFVTGDKMKTDVSGYLQVLYDAEPKAVGGALPDDAFYYGA